MLAWGRILSPGDVFVDVGANAGLYFVMAADMGARVVSVEPFAECRKALAANRALNGFEFEIVPAALASDALIEQCGRTMTLTEDKGPRNHLLLQDGSRGARVPVMTLDEVIDDKVDRNEVVTGLKVDVEGAELLVLEGAVRAISGGRVKWIQLEYNTLARDNGSPRTATPPGLFARSQVPPPSAQRGWGFASVERWWGWRPDLFAEYTGDTAV